MKECVKCRILWKCEKYPGAYRDAWEKHPAHSVEDAEKRTNYMRNMFKDCEQFVNLFDNPPASADEIYKRRIKISKGEP